MALVHHHINEQDGFYDKKQSIIIFSHIHIHINNAKLLTIHKILQLQLNTQHRHHQTHTNTSYMLTGQSIPTDHGVIFIQK